VSYCISAVSATPVHVCNSCQPSSPLALFISACRTIYHPSFCCRDLLPDVPDEGGYLRAVQT
jgi:hypothetical protein